MLAVALGAVGVLLGVAVVVGVVVVGVAVAVGPSLPWKVNGPAMLVLPAWSSALTKIVNSPATSRLGV